MFWDVSECFGMFWDIFGRLLGRFGMLWNVLECFGTFVERFGMLLEVFGRCCTFSDVVGRIGRFFFFTFWDVLGCF